MHEGVDRVAARQTVTAAWQGEWETSSKGARTRWFISLVAVGGKEAQKSRFLPDPSFVGARVFQVILGEDETEKHEKL